MVSQRLHPYIAGAEVQALGLARALVARGAQVRIVTTRVRGGLPERETIDGVEVRRLPVTPEPLDRGASFSIAAKLSQLFAMALYVGARGRSYNVVHAHCISASSLGATLGASMAGVPSIIKPSLGGRDGELQKIVESTAAGALLPILRRVDRYAVMEPSIADELASVGVSRDRFADVTNGINLERFRPASPDERRAARERLALPPGPVALFLGQLIERKGVGALLEAWRDARAHLPGATLVFVGHGAEEGRIEREAAAQGSQVRFLGARDNAVEIMHAADALVLPSRNESFGNVIVEALACGLPVIVGRTGVAAALELEGIAGRFVDPDDPASIGAALVDVLGTPGRAASLGACARDLVRQFDFAAVAKRYEEIYVGMMGVRDQGAGVREERVPTLTPDP